MERRLGFILIVLWMGVFPSVRAQVASRQIALDSVLALGLPVVEVLTVDSIEPMAEQATEPEGTSGHTVVNATKVPGRLRIWAGDKTLLYDSGDFLDGKSGMTIKIRGNNSALRELKPFKVKLQKKADLLLRGNEAQFKDKNWLLLREWKNTLNTPIGFKVNELLGLPWTPAYKHVNLLVNGEYRGLYMLTEQVRRNPRCRINVDEERGFIVERDIYWWVALLCFETDMVHGMWMRYTMKYPDEEDVTADQLERVRQQMNEMEASIQRGDYDDYIDTRSFAAWLLGHDLLGTFDAGGSNRYFVKYDDSPEAKVTMPCLWDFDSNFYMDSTWSMLHDYYGTYQRDLFRSDNKAFSRAYVDLWRELSTGIEGAMASWLDSLETGNEGRALDASRALEQRCGFRPFVSVGQNAGEAMAWFTARRAWMDEHMAEVDSTYVPAYVSDLKVCQPSSVQRFDLMGRPLRERPLLGVYIENGRKRVAVSR